MPEAKSLNTIELHQGRSIEQENYSNRTFVDISIPVGGEDFEISISYSARHAKLSELTSVCRKISDMIISRVREYYKSSTEKIACQNGCDACCHYMVPLSSAEAFSLNDDIAAMSRNKKRNAVRNMILTARRILEHHVPKLAVEKSDHSEDSILGEMSDFYKMLKPACPFLEYQSCQIYEKRPLACREHLVSGNISGCKSGETGVAKVIEIPISLAEVLNNVSNYFEGTDSESIILPITLVWCDMHEDRALRTYPAEVLVSTLTKFIRQAAAKTKTITSATA